MSTTISTAQTATILPKSIAKLKEEEKPRLQRSTSIETIKRINTFICSPQTYILPAILMTWLKTSQTGLQASTEKTILMFRSLIFGFILQKLVTVWAKSEAHKTNVCLQKASAQLVAKVTKDLPKVSTVIAFYLATFVLIAQIVVCVMLLKECVLPLGFHFLLTAGTYTVSWAYKLNTCVKPNRIK